MVVRVGFSLLPLNWKVASIGGHLVLKTSAEVVLRGSNPQLSAIKCQFCDDGGITSDCKSETLETQKVRIL